jgi:hypothetical protein
MIRVKEGERTWELDGHIPIVEGIIVRTPPGRFLINDVLVSSTNLRRTKRTIDERPQVAERRSTIAYRPKNLSTQSTGDTGTLGQHVHRKGQRSGPLIQFAVD